MEAGPGVVHGCCGVVADAHDDVDAAVASRRLDASWRLAHDDRYRSINQSINESIRYSPLLVGGRYGRAHERVRELDGWRCEQQQAAKQ